MFTKATVHPVGYTGAVPADARTTKPRRRGDALTGAIYLATLEELARTGLEPLAFDRIAAVAGAGKASLYRRWATPAELVLAALTDPLTGFGEPTPEPGTGTLRGDLVELLTGLARVLEQPHGRALRPLVAQRERHPELHARVVELVLAPRQRLLLRVLERAVERGEADPAAVTPRVATVGPRLVLTEHDHRGPVSAAEVEAIVDEVLLPLAAPRKRA